MPKVKLSDVVEFIEAHARFSDAERLRWIRTWVVESRNGSHIHRRLSSKWRLMASIEENKTPDNRLFLVESGRDCDGVVYSGHIHMVDANLKAVDDKYDELGRWADGPFRLDIISEQDARETVCTSRDLAAEAFEDGHPHNLSEVRYETH